MEKSIKEDDLQEKLVENYFSNYANLYYKENHDPDLKNCYSYSHIVRKNHILKMLDINGGKVLDVGCGPGVISLNLLLRGYEVWSVDVSKEMIDEAAKQIEKTEYKNKAHFCVGNVTSLDFPENNFDAVVCAGVLEYLENEDKAIKEIYRVLKPNGIAIITVPTPRGFYDFALRLSNFILKPFISKLRKIKQKRIKRESRSDSSIRNFKQKTFEPKQLDELVINNKFQKIDYAHYHFISFLIALFAPSFSLNIGEKLDLRFSKSKKFGRFGKGYIVKVKK